MTRRLVLTILLALVLTGSAFAGGIYGAISELDPHFNWVDAGGKISNQEAQIANNAVPYPLADVQATGGFLERRNLRERLLRFNQSGKVGYVYLTTALGHIYGYYTISGKISSTQSQLTPTEQAYYHSIDQLVQSVSDDGSYGPNEGGPGGVFFFTTSGVMVETDQPFIYSDAPLPINAQNLNPKQKPSSTSRYFKKK